MMPSFLVKLGPDEYCEYSTVVDAPTSFIQSRETAVAEWGEDRIARCDENNVWSVKKDPAEFGYTCGWDVMKYNRAGESVAGFKPPLKLDDKGEYNYCYSLSVDQIRKYYSGKNEGTTK